MSWRVLTCGILLSLMAWRVDARFGAPSPTCIEIKIDESLFRGDPTDPAPVYDLWMWA